MHSLLTFYNKAKELKIPLSKTPSSCLERTRNEPAHVIQEAVRTGHPVDLMLMLFQKINITLLWNKLKELNEGWVEEKNEKVKQRNKIDLQQKWLSHDDVE